MSEFNISIESGTSKRLPVGNKWSEKDIIVTATGGKEDLDDVLTEQEGLIEELQDVLAGKTSGGGIIVVSENLHDKSTDVANVYLEKGAEATYKGWDLTDYIPTKEGKHYFVYSNSAISGKWTGKYGADKVYLGTLPIVCSCTEKKSPLLLSGHNGYVRFSGTASSIASLEVYEVTGFAWEVNG